MRADIDQHEDPRKRLRAICKGLGHLNHLVHEAVAEARAKGVTWEQIAEDLEVSPQVVKKRFRRLSRSAR